MRNIFCIIASFQQFCSTLRYNLTAQEISDMQIRLNDVTGLPEVDCFAELVVQFMEVRHPLLFENPFGRFQEAMPNVNVHLSGRYKF